MGKIYTPEIRKWANWLISMVHVDSKGFKDVVFGKASAEKEKTPGYRKLLLEGFLDEYSYKPLISGQAL
jgi:hypothetical protein